MRLYLDDAIAGPRLAHFLRGAGHDVVLPADVGLIGKADSIHLAHAIHGGRVCLSRNYGDYENLHLLLREATGHHPGILVVRRDDNPKRNLAPRDIVRALHNLEAAGIPLGDEYIILNAWQ